MEEIDSIILDSLRNLHCDLDQCITSLKDFDADMTVGGISRCLETIIPDGSFPKKLPPSMSHKLKIATSLAAQIKSLGYRDDIGYQTILYCNEAEIRRVFMFLIERLPRESGKTPHVEQTGYVPTLVKEIEQKIKDSLQQVWVPSCVLQGGVRKGESGLLFYNFGECSPLRAKQLKVPCVNEGSKNEDLKEYWSRHVPVVTKQCSSKELIPSLLFQDCIITENEVLRKCFKISLNKDQDIPSDILLDSKLVKNQQTESDQLTEESEFENKLQTLLSQLKLKKEEYLSIETNIKSFQGQLEQATNSKNDENESLQKMISQVNLKAKTLTVISKEENLQKLKNMIEASKTKLLSLTEQWKEVQTPLLEEHKTLQIALNSKDLEQQKELVRLKKLEEISKTLVLDLEEKTQLQEQLKQKLSQISKTQTRSGYTRRIFEIIANIKKQDEEIQKILKDTREVQREISLLTGQVDRSFTLADELIFRDAKHDETARKAYKLLAQLRDDCSGIIKAISDLGLVERESRNLQEQIDSETAKDTAVKLERVSSDLREIKKEVETLKQKRQT